MIFLHVFTDCYAAKQLLKHVITTSKNIINYQSAIHNNDPTIEHRTMPFIKILKKIPTKKHWDTTYSDGTSRISLGTSVHCSSTPTAAFDWQIRLPISIL